MFALFLENPIIGILAMLGLVAAITIHEFAHAWVADKLGDPTPRLQDRVSLDPRKHLDPMGTLLILFLGFGWGKPVEFDPFNLKHLRRDAALIALAGPASNLLTAGILALAMRLLPLLGFVDLAAALTIQLSVMLAVFNMIPIHPLDGGKIILAFLPEETAHEWDEMMHRYGIWILLFLILPLGGQSAASRLIQPIISTIVSFMI